MLDNYTNVLLFSLSVKLVSSFLVANFLILENLAFRWWSCLSWTHSQQTKPETQSAQTQRKQKHDHRLMFCCF
jgi:hypothetical protein